MKWRNSNKPLWGITRIGVRLAMGSLLMVGGLSAWVFGNTENFSIYWEYPLLLDILIIAAPLLVATVVLVLCGFFIREIEWRVSHTGINWFMGVSIFGMLLSAIVYTLIIGQDGSSGRNSILALILTFSTPLLPATASFVYWGFRAAEADKKNRYRFRGLL